MSTLLLKGAFIASKVGKTGLSPTVDLYRIALSDASSSKVVTDGAASEVGGGVYVYRYASADGATYEYVSVFKTADATVDQQQVHGQHFVMPDELVGSRLATTGYTAPDNAAVADAVLDEAMAGHNIVGTFAATVTAANTVASAANAVAQKLDTMLEVDNDVSRFTANALEEGPGGGAAGSGAITFAYTVTNAVGGAPIDGVDVYAYTDAGLANLVASGQTNAFGVVTFYLDAGTYYLKRVKPGYSFIDNPDVEVVS